jgi:hypothetical protein
MPFFKSRVQKMADRRDAAGLIGLLGTKLSQQEYQEAVDALSRIVSTGDFDTLATALQRGNIGVIEVVGRIGGVRAAVTLLENVERLSSELARVTFQEALIRIGPSATLPIIIARRDIAKKAFKNQSSQQDKIHVLYNGLLSLARFKPCVEPQLVDVLEDGDTSVRNVTIQALNEVTRWRNLSEYDYPNAQSHDEGSKASLNQSEQKTIKGATKRAIHLLLVYLRDPDARTRDLAKSTLPEVWRTWHKDMEVPDELKVMLQEKENAAVAAYILAKSRTPNAVNLLLQFDDKNKEPDKDIINALNEDHIPVLHNMLERTIDQKLRAEIIDKLCRYGDEDAVPAALGLIHSDDESIRTTGAYALAAIFRTYGFERIKEDIIATYGSVYIKDDLTESDDYTYDPSDPGFNPVIRTGGKGVERTPRDLRSFLT